MCHYAQNIMLSDWPAMTDAHAHVTSDHICTSLWLDGMNVALIFYHLEFAEILDMFALSHSKHSNVSLRHFLFKLPRRLISDTRPRIFQTNWCQSTTLQNLSPSLKVRCVNKNNSFKDLPKEHIYTFTNTCIPSWPGNLLAPYPVALPAVPRVPVVSLLCLKCNKPPGFSHMSQMGNLSLAKG